MSPGAFALAGRPPSRQSSTVAAWSQAPEQRRRSQWVVCARPDTPMQSCERVVLDAYANSFVRQCARRARQPLVDVVRLIVEAHELDARRHDP